MKQILLLLLSWMIFFTCKAQDQTRFAVVELFTSESCLSCPDGDKNLSDLSSEMRQKGQPVYCLEYHVDYWGKNDWKDPFGKNQFSFRQENYSRVLPGKEMYTPQLIINGSTELNAADRMKMRSETEKALLNSKGRKMALAIDSVKNDSVYIHYSCAAAAVNQLLRLALTENGLQSTVSSGVNKGKTLHHDNVVRIFYTVDAPVLNGSCAIPLKGFLPNARCELTGFLQEKKTMRISSALRIKF